MNDTWRYSAYGEIMAGEETGQPFRFTGRRHDAETGLYYYRARYYSPILGRFRQTDLIGYGDQMNMYAYVGNDPVNGVDPFGLACVCGDSYSDRIMNAGRELGRQVAESPTKVDDAIVLGTLSLMTFGSAYAVAPIATTELGTIGTEAVYEEFAGPGTAIALSSTLTRMSQGGDNLLEATINAGDEMVDVAAELVVKGKELIVDAVTMFGRNGDLPKGSATQAMFKAKSELVDAARNEGFEQLTINARRTETSSSANPGKTVCIEVDLCDQ